ncbi:MAG: heme-binding protein [Neisseriaceae bacterium]|nr:heme-binding protein [Neisseriaceae bacterium]
MQQKYILDEQAIDAILTTARQEAKKQQWAVTISIVDEGGHPLGLLRMDGAAPMSALIAQEKAKTAALSRKETLVYETMIKQGRTAFLSTPLQGLLEGGLPIIIEGHCIGAVGVSGLASDLDAQLARLAIASIL